MSDDLVVLLDDRRRPIDQRPKSEVHHGHTPLHLAFSLYLLDGRGRLLLTRRALGKKSWPGVWSNSCCGHPQPGEALADAVRRRLAEELGLRVDGLRPVLPDFSYRAVDAGGVVENEFCPVFVGSTDADPRPDPAEVMDWAWADPSRVADAMRATPFAFSPWSVLQMAQLGPMGWPGAD